MQTPKFTIGDKVFAKVRGYTPWPAKVEGVVDGTSNKVVKYNVYFYGTKQMAVCKEEDLFPYSENKELLGKPKKNKGFNDSILEIDSELNSSSNSIVIPEIDDSQSVYDSPSERKVVKIKSTPVSFRKFPERKNKTSVQKSHKQRNEQKNKSLRSLKTESRIVDIDFQIQCSLCLNKADPDTCLKHLDELSALEFNLLIIKKNPEIVRTLQKLQIYVGNIGCWNMTNEEAEIFTSKARIIQQKSKIIYDKIQSLFSIPFGKTFTEVFEEELNKFRSCTVNMAHEDFYCLTKDPTDFCE
uniref:PWWP domain-containing protein n=1 Tax=Graphocephala atropunctata TaxID=36148 RepID=A0A1B6MRZ3_9HEMI